MALTGRKAIRKQFRKDYRVAGNYDEVGRLWGVSGGLAWKMINEDHYWPSDKKIEKMILLVASRIGINIGNPGGKDLWAMSKKELLWRLENRETL